MEPEITGTETIDRSKFVDDFNDNMASDNFDVLKHSVKHNLSLLYKQASSVGLKLNDAKTKFLFMNLSECEQKEIISSVTPEDLLDNAIISIENSHKLLGFQISINKNNKINADGAAKNLITRLNAASRVVSSMRKAGSSLEKLKFRVSVATKLIFSACYDIGLCYVYSSKKQFQKIETAIKKVIKSAGLDWFMKSDLVYQVSTILTPAIMAKKQIMQLGLKFIDKEAVIQNRFNIPRHAFDNRRPFWSIFREVYEDFPLETRKVIIENFNPLDKKQTIKVKGVIRKHYLTILYPEGLRTQNKIDAILSKNVYCFMKVLARKLKNLQLDSVPQEIRENVPDNLGTERKIKRAARSRKTKNPPRKRLKATESDKTLGSQTKRKDCNPIQKSPKKSRKSTKSPKRGSRAKKSRPNSSGGNG